MQPPSAGWVFRRRHEPHVRHDPHRGAAKPSAAARFVRPKIFLTVPILSDTIAIARTIGPDGNTVRADPPRITGKVAPMTRREKLESMLQSATDDTFLKYALAMQCASDGDDAAGIRHLEELLASDSHYVPAYFQAAQLLAKANDADRSRQLLTRGIEVAHATGDEHAEREMRGFLEQLE